MTSNALIRTILRVTALSTISLTLSCGGGGSGGSNDEPIGPFPRYAYIVHASDRTVSMFRIEGEMGQLVHQGYVFAGAQPVAIAVDPEHRFVYVANNGSSDVSAWSIDQDTGLLAPVAGSPFAVGLAPVALAIDGLGTYVYVANSGSDDLSALLIDPSTGALSSVPGSPYACGDSPVGVAADASGTVFVANATSNDLSVFEIEDVLTGELAIATGSPFMAGVTPVGVAVEPVSKTLYVASRGSNDLSAWSYDANSACTPLSGSPFSVGDTPAALAVSGSSVLVANAVSNDIFVFRISASLPLTLAAAKGSPFANTGFQPATLAVEPTGHFAYVGDGQTRILAVYALDPASGALTPQDPLATRASPAGIAATQADDEVELDRWSVYVAESSGHVLAFDFAPDTGFVELAGSPHLAGLNTTAIAVDPRGRFVYAANNDSHDVWAWSRNQATGELALVAGLLFPAGIAPEALAVDPAGRFVYVANGDSDDVSGFAIEAGGELTPLAGSPFAIEPGAHPRSIAIDPSGRFAYVAERSAHQVAGFEIDPVTGALARIPATPIATGLSPVAVAADPRGQFLFVASRDSNDLLAFHVNDVGGLFATAPSLMTGLRPQALALMPSGEFLYCANEQPTTISAFEVAREEGRGKDTLGEIEGSPFAIGHAAGSAAVDASGQFLFLVSSSDDRLRVFALEADGGLDVEIASIGVEHAPQSVAVFAHAGKARSKDSR